MHTVITSFGDRYAARRAVDRLVEAGIRRTDIHLETTEAAGQPALDPATWDGMEREIAVDRRVLESIGNFFGGLFGRDRESAGHVASYSQAVEQGGCVLVLEAPDEYMAQRARSILHEAGGNSAHTMERGLHHRSLRDLVAARRDEEERQERPAEVRSAIRREQAERAFAFGGEPRSPEQRERDAEVSHAPGLRYADKEKDKPGR